MKKLKTKKKKEADIDEITNVLKRLQAEFENFKKRTEKEKQEFVKFASQNILIKLLPIIDSFDLALEHKNDKKEFTKGVQLIHEQLLSTVKAEGLQQIDTKDKKFDPYLHEVMLTETSDKDEDIVLEELQTGYILNGKVIRHSKVKISKKRG